MPDENKSVLVKRTKSFLWRAGMMVLSLGISFVLDNIGLFELNPAVITIVGLVFGEISKHINSKLMAAKALKAKMAKLEGNHYP